MASLPVRIGDRLIDAMQYKCVRCVMLCCVVLLLLLEEGKGKAILIDTADG
jgi:hypothetical protein